ncbi:MAG: Hsp20/alpha crystallin family protein [Proteobacteria bacterium]|nr:Hsp20/alpha crystallin family protein [Pseudomonadota bacterium]
MITTAITRGKESDPAEHRLYNNTEKPAIGTGQKKSHLSRRPRREFMPAVEIEERDDRYVIRAEVPGMSRESLDIHASGNLLTMIGTHEEPRSSDGGYYLTCERSYGSFGRSFTFPRPVDCAGMTVELDLGVLTIQVPKKY